MSFTGRNDGRQFEPFANLDAKLSRYLLRLNNIVWITAAMGPFFLVRLQCKKNRSYGKE